MDQIADCLSELKMPNGTITSPGYPHYYPSGSPYDCTIIISQPFGNIIRLTIEEIDIEWSTGCTYDWLELMDGYHGNKLMDKLCGYEPSALPAVASKENIVRIRQAKLQFCEKNINCSCANRFTFVEKRVKTQ